MINFGSLTALPNACIHHGDDMRRVGGSRSGVGGSRSGGGARPARGGRSAQGGGPGAKPMHSRGKSVPPRARGGRSGPGAKPAHSGGKPAHSRAKPAHSRAKSVPPHAGDGRSARGGGPGAKPAPKYLYHYTDAKSAAKIEASGQLKPSSRGQLGKGTYPTSMRSRQ